MNINYTKSIVPKELYSLKIIFSLITLILKKNLCLGKNRLTHFELFLCMVWYRGQTFFLSHVEIQLSQHHSLTRLFLPPLNGLDTCIWVYFWTLNSIPLVYMFILKPVPHCFDYWNFVISFEIKKCWVLQLYSSFSRLFWLFQVPCNSIWISGSGFCFWI